MLKFISTLAVVFALSVPSFAAFDGSPASIRIVANEAAIEAMQQEDQRLRAAVASTAAMGNHAFSPDSGRLQVSLAGGHYRGDNAASVAVGLPLGKSLFVNGAFSRNSERDNVGAVGATLTF